VLDRRVRALSEDGVPTRILDLTVLSNAVEDGREDMGRRGCEEVQFLVSGSGMVHLYEFSLAQMSVSVSRPQRLRTNARSIRRAVHGLGDPWVSRLTDAGSWNRDSHTCCCASPRLPLHLSCANLHLPNSVPRFSQDLRVGWLSRNARHVFRSTRVAL
jgi:hypothetical protein